MAPNCSSCRPRRRQVTSRRAAPTTSGPNGNLGWVLSLVGSRERGGVKRELGVGFESGRESGEVDADVRTGVPRKLVGVSHFRRTSIGSVRVQILSRARTKAKMTSFSVNSSHDQAESISRQT